MSLFIRITGCYRVITDIRVTTVIRVIRVIKVIMTPFFRNVLCEASHSDHISITEC
jgi:hypothetical protein